MDAASEIVLDFLTALADAHRSLNHLAIALQARPEVVEVHQTFQCWTYPANVSPFLEHYVEVTTTSGQGLCGTPEVSAEEGEWCVSSSVSEAGKFGGTNVVTFLERTASTLPELVVQLGEATAALAESVETFDFLSYE